MTTVAPTRPKPEITLLSPPESKHNIWGKLYGATTGLAITEYAKDVTDLVVVVTANMPDLMRIEAELSFFGSTPLQTNSFVEWETLPYDRVSPHQDIISQRVRSLYSLSEQHKWHPATDRFSTDAEARAPIIS